EAFGDTNRAAELLGATGGKFYPAALDFYRSRASALRDRLTVCMTAAEVAAATARGQNTAFDPLAVAG
ncbi:MAG TPA: hypothetical protein VK461_11100, partial [Acidimicrobiales bacterium]|nr:hypothetical protein [Acidimicrobiales bacterium]